MMKTTSVFLFATITLCFAMNGSVNQPEQSTAYQNQAAFKISVYKKDLNNLDKPIFCDELLMSDMTKNILITCHNANKIEYSLFSNPITAQRLHSAQEGFFSQRTIFCFRQDPLKVALVRFEYIKPTNSYVELFHNIQHLSNDVLTFTKDDFIVKLQEITIKVPVQEPTEIK